MQPIVLRQAKVIWTVFQMYRFINEFILHRSVYLHVLSVCGLNNTRHLCIATTWLPHMSHVRGISTPKPAQCLVLIRANLIFHSLKIICTYDTKWIRHSLCSLFTKWHLSKYKWKRCSKKKCCKQCGRVKFMGTMTQT